MCKRKLFKQEVILNNKKKETILTSGTGKTRNLSVHKG